MFDFTGSTDVEEAGFLVSSALAAGMNTLTVNYNVDAASSAVAAGYSGNLTLAPVVSAVVPEPATWAMMMAGFGIVGAGLRRRRTLTTVAA